MELDEKPLVERLATLLKAWDHAVAVRDIEALDRLDREMRAVTRTPEFFVALRETSTVRGPTRRAR